MWVTGRGPQQGLQSWAFSLPAPFPSSLLPDFQDRQTQASQGCTWTAPKFRLRRQQEQKIQSQPVAFVITLPARKPLRASLVFLWGWLILLERKTHEKVPFPLKTEGFQWASQMCQDHPLPQLSMVNARVGQEVGLPSTVLSEMFPPGPPPHPQGRHQVPKPPLSSLVLSEGPGPWWICEKNKHLSQGLGKKGMLKERLP